ncbi:programmed cell death protein 7 [Cocos nucifera]|uniref:Programmed cell death protein 7 n=1 Tax=Cocos nucifera TaxID=13894 RepID=A0A8K0HYB4_COCNU|nr:programmed cell death protein 7 [Cocos nucifera]
MEEEGKAAHVLTLFDLYWFHRQILRPSPPPPPPPPLPPLLDLEDAESHTSESPPAAHPSLHLRRHRRSLSDETDASAEPRVQTPKLQTILSGKEAPVEDLARRNGAIGGRGEIWTAAARRRRRGRSRGRSRVSSRSLSELEFEEVKGFMDLGFTFSEAEADPRLMSIVPGLQRLGKRATGDGEPVEEGSSCASDVVDESAISRPYLSEAWDAQEEEEENMLRNWRIPAAADAVDLKDHLRFWAHAVASTVR